jgi:DNA-binding transcriptional LysR family regulator
MGEPVPLPETMAKFQEMKVFAAVVDAGSFTGAARALDMPKAAVSRYVADLEERPGLRLLHRTTRKLSPTTEGEIFHARCRELLDNLDQAEAEITSRSGEASGLLKANVPVTFGLMHLAPMWPALLARGEPAHPRELAAHDVISYSLFASGENWTFTGPEGEVMVKVSPRMRTNSGDTCRAAAGLGQRLRGVDEGAPGKRRPRRAAGLPRGCAFRGPQSLDRRAPAASVRGDGRGRSGGESDAAALELRTRHPGDGRLRISMKRRQPRAVLKNLGVPLS